MSDNFSISYELKQDNPLLRGLPFLEMKEAALGKDYELSLVFISPEKSRALNKQYRGKDQPTDILSFPLSEKSGEIFIDIATAEIAAKKFSRDLPNFIQFLVIHGLAHLKGFQHGTKMEKEEKNIRKIFDI